VTGERKSSSPGIKLSGSDLKDIRSPVPADSAEAPLVAEVKAGKTAPASIENWLGEYDALFLRRDHADPLVVVPWRIWAQLLARVR
jgi:hypothetical protein